MHQFDTPRLRTRPSPVGRAGAEVEVRAAITAAQAAEAAARERVAAAEARIAEVVEQRAAAEAILVTARRELVELEVSGQGENAVRRALERTGQEARTAEAAAAAAHAAVQQQAAALVAAEVALATAEEGLAVLRAVGGCDREAVVAALARYQGTALVLPHPGDLALADELERLAAEVVPVEPAALAAAERAVTEAQLALEELVRPAARVVPDWWDELARLHTEVVEAQAALDGSFAGRNARRRLEDAVAAERILLAELGYPSHLDALMSGGRPAGERRAASTRAAKAVLGQAEADLARLREGMAAAEELRRLVAHAAAIVGRPGATVHPDDLRRPRPDPDAAAALALAMGVQDVPEPVLAGLARTWLAEHARAAHGLDDAVAEHAAATEALDHTRAALAAAEAAAATAAAVVQDARRQVDVLEGELGNRVVPVADPATRAATAAALRDRIGSLEDRVAAAEAGAAEERAAADVDLAAATAALAAALRTATALESDGARADALSADPASVPLRRAD